MPSRSPRRPSGWPPGASSWPRSQRRHRVFETTLRGDRPRRAGDDEDAPRATSRSTWSRDLATVTGGRYRRVRVDDKTLDIEVLAPERGDWVQVATLSQGTLDLVYLAARLGLVRLVTGDRRPPLVFDDPFVTLDDDARDARPGAAQVGRDRLPGHLPDDLGSLRRARPTPSSSCRPDGVDDGVEDPRRHRRSAAPERPA